MDSFSDHNNGSQEESGSCSENKARYDEASIDDSTNKHCCKSNSDLSNSNSNCSLGAFLSCTCNASPVRLSGAKLQQFMDSLSLSSSSLNSDIHDFDDDEEGNRASFFIESSRVSVSSDDEEPLSNLIDFILSDRPQGEDSDIYNDWDSGLSHSSIEFQRDDAESWTNSLTERPVQEFVLDFPRRTVRSGECQICLETTYLRRRVCCDFEICNKCLSLYLTGKVQDGKVQIECPNDRCKALIHTEEIRHRLSVEMRERYLKFLIDANKNPYVKTCPSCSLPYEIDRARLKISKKKLKRGVEVTCTQCRLVWCFRCQAPFHTNLSCKKYKNEDEMVKRWAKERIRGQSNAQQCPKCKIYVQKVDGCDHMKCTECETNFCYRCGDRYISVKFFGNHWNRYSLFGCKYRLMPEKGGLRRLIRGSHFVARVLAAVVFAGLGVVAGAVLVAGSVIIVPGYGIYRLRRHMWAAKQRKKFQRQKMRMISVAEKQRALMEKQFVGILETVVEESETEMSEPVPDPQQVQVMVHHAEGQDEIPVMDESKDCDIFFNKYIGEDTEVAVSRSAGKGHTALADSKVEIATTHSDVKDDSSESKNTKLVFDLASSVKEKQCEEDGNSTKDKVSDVLAADKDKNDIIVEKEIESGNLDKGNEPLALNLTKKKDGVIESVDGYSSDHLSSVSLKKQSLSKGKNNTDEKITKTKVLKDTDKSPVPEKIEGENIGRGCFGNIFSVAKRTTGVTSVLNSNEEDFLKSEKPNKPKIQSLTVKKAATWEKCRRSKVEIDSGLKSSVDSVNSCNNFPLLVHKSPSSFSSIIGFSFVDDELEKKKEGDLYDCLPHGEIDLKPDYTEKTDVNLKDEIRNSLGGEGVIKHEVEITASEDVKTSTREHEYISQVSVITHL